MHELEMIISFKGFASKIKSDLKYLLVVIVFLNPKEFILALYKLRV